MNATGIIRRVDDLGRIVIPKELRRKFNITEGTPMEYFLSNDGLTLKVYHTESQIKEQVNQLLIQIEEDASVLGYEKVGKLRKLLKDVKEELSD